MNNNNDIPLASRPASSPFGKCTEEVKARIPYDIKEGFTRIAHEMGMTESELLREMVLVKVLGLDMVNKIYRERLERVAGIGHEKP